jgi:cytoplasmic iron level regulating protein YaaA (DUF328/UPF0246 family)
MSRPLFEQWKGGKFKMVRYLAGKARGLTARYSIVNRVDEPAGLRGFGSEGCACAPGASDADACVFRRNLEA